MAALQEETGIVCRAAGNGVWSLQRMPAVGPNRRANCVADVCFEGKSGSGADLRPCCSLTRSDTSRPPITALRKEYRLGLIGSIRLGGANCTTSKIHTVQLEYQCSILQRRDLLIEPRKVLLPLGPVGGSRDQPRNDHAASSKGLARLRRLLCLQIDNGEF